MATRRQAMPPVAYALLAALTISILGGLFAVSAAFAHERDEEHDALDAAAVERALRGADWLVERAREHGRSVAPLSTGADARGLRRWLSEAGGVADRETLEAFRQYLTAIGYDDEGHDPLFLWGEDMERALTAHVAVETGALGEDTARYWDALQAIPEDADDETTRRQVDELRRRIELASVSEAEAEAVRPHRGAIETLLETAREWRND